MAKRRGNPDSIGGFFRKLFNEKPELLQQKKNDEILAHYRRQTGMPEGAPIEKRILSNLANVKSVMRKKGCPGATTIHRLAYRPATPPGSRLI